MRIFISGTDTNIGKTITSAWLCAHSQYDYYKPIQTGIEDEIDSKMIKQLSPSTAIIQETYALPKPLSPHLSARFANKSIDLKQIQLPENPDVIIEGAGGLMVPLNQKFLMIDLIAQLKTPLLLVASSKLGTINHTLLSLSILRHYQIPILGVIMNGIPNPDNVEAIEFYGDIEVLAQLPMMELISHENLLKHPLPQKLRQILEQ